MRKLLVLGGVAALALWATPAGATPITDACPRLNGGFTGGTAVDPTYQSNAANLGTANGGCNVLITFGANGSITTTHPNTQGFYDDGRDDNLVGIVNNLGVPITSFFLSSGSFAIFNFDNDGVCGTLTTGAGGGVPGYTASNGSMATLCGTSDSSGYLPQGITKTGGDIFQGTVNFAGGIPSGQAAFFSLEGPVDQNLFVGPPTTGGTPTAVPEPTSLLLLGTGILACARRMRKAQFNVE
jgi:hypothetical protein